MFVTPLCWIDVLPGALKDRCQRLIAAQSPVFMRVPGTVPTFTIDLSIRFVNLFHWVSQVFYGI